MKKLFILTLLFTLGIVSLAQDAGNYVVIEQPTNVRSAPQVYPYLVRGVVSDTNLTVTGRNFDGHPVCITTHKQDAELWLQVTVDGIEGWVKFCRNDFVGDLSTVPITTAVNPEYRACFDVGSSLDRLGEEPDKPNIIASTKENTINLREQPDISSERIDILRSSEVYVTGRTADNVWLKVHYNAVLAKCGWNKYGLEQVTTEGWVAAFLLDLPEGWQDIVPVIER